MLGSVRRPNNGPSNLSVSAKVPSLGCSLAIDATREQHMTKPLYAALGVDCGMAY